MSRNEHVRALVDVDTLGLACFNARFSIGFSCRIPRGSVTRVYWVGPIGFSCTQEGELQTPLVSETEKESEMRVCRL
jgi:hypothetical protein